MEPSTISYKDKLSGTIGLVISSGLIATVVQVLYIREITTVFQGNELMMTWTLGTWMFLTGAGALFGRKPTLKISNISRITRLIYLITVLAVILIPAMSLAKSWLIPTGVMVHPLLFFLFVLVFLFPLCFLLGIVYSFLIKSFYYNENGFIRVYAYESVGSIIGGLLVTFLLIRWLPIFEALLILAFVVHFYLFFARRKTGYLISGLLCIILGSLWHFSGMDNTLKSVLYGKQKVIESIETYYGNLTLTESSGQFTFFVNGAFLYTTGNTVVSEEFVHYCLLQHPDPHNVLLVSGSVEGMLNEILKYPHIQSITCIEQNPEILRLAEKYIHIPQSDRIKTVFGDVRRYIRTDATKYDAVILALPDPSSLQINRLYTARFIESIKARLNQGGIIIYGVSPAGNYLSTDQKQLEAAVYNTLINAFHNVKLIPGERDYYIASDSVLSDSISRLCLRYNFDNTFVNPYYIDDSSIRERSRIILAGIQYLKHPDTDEKPYPVFYHTLQFLSHFGSHVFLLLIFPLLIMVLPVFRIRSLSGSIYITGFTAASVEILIIFSMQVIFGYVYAAIGLIISVFMLGLAIGAILAGRNHMVLNHLSMAQLLFIIYMLAFLLFWSTIDKSKSPTLVLISFFILTLVPSMLTGFIYVAVTRLTPGSVKESAPGNYAFDLLGSALGIFVFSVFILPLTGMKIACAILAGLNILALLMSRVTRSIHSN
jgi:spermidine synthase